jgi:outer membrane immunogenic protein
MLREAHRSYDPVYTENLIRIDDATVGAGAAIDHNWSIKLEYLYMDLGNVGGSSTTATNVVTQLGVPVRFNTVTTTALTSAFNSPFADKILRVGVNHRFDAPVAAKY